MRERVFMGIALAAGLASAVAPATGQGSSGPFVLHPGMKITTSFTNEFGQDADSTTTIASVSDDTVSVDYASSRGLTTRRNILTADRRSATAYVLGYAPKMPATIPATTSLGISSAVLTELRNRGRSMLTLVHSAELERIDCELTSTGVDVRVPVIIEDKIFDLPTIQARASCGSGSRTGSGTLVFASDVNNPVLIESVLNFSWEHQPRTERVTRVVAGPGMHRDMKHSLATLGYYDVYGLHFDFDSTRLRPETAQLVGEIAQMLQENPGWVIQITGHTDSIGGADYNVKLSIDRASAIREALIREGVAAGRLEATGLGMTKPKADNGTLAGRAINRRVEFRRLDR